MGLGCYSLGGALHVCQRRLFFRWGKGAPRTLMGHDCRPRCDLSSARCLAVQQMGAAASEHKHCVQAAWSIEVLCWALHPAALQSREWISCYRHKH